MAFETIFDKTLEGSGTTSSKDDWFSVATIPSGKQYWVAFISFACWDKQLSFEIRANKPTKSAGNVTDTDKLEYVAVPVGGEVLDLYKNGIVKPRTCPIAANSTGVEKLWIRAQSPTNAAAVFDYFIDYSEITV
jgi:hypothetical protein